MNDAELVLFYHKVKNSKGSNTTKELFFSEIEIYVKSINQPLISESLDNAHIRGAATTYCVISYCAEDLPQAKEARRTPGPQRSNLRELLTEDCAAQQVAALSHCFVLSHLRNR